MRLAMNFIRDGETLFRFVSEELGDSDLLEAHTEGMRQFRDKYPDSELWDITVGYDKG
ncbi:MAG: hypothetical protein AAFO57_04275 [Pseudomonadota bacterium]